MKIAIFSESSADEAAVRILAEAVLKQPIEPVASRALRRPRSGWTRVRALLSSVIKDLYYQTDADGLIVVVDSDDTPFHAVNHDRAIEQECRLCQFLRAADDSRKYLKPRPVAKPLHVAIGLAPNAIETWLLYPTAPHYCEAAWIRGQSSQQLPFSRRDLKLALYRTISPGLTQETAAMIAAAEAVAKRLDDFERAFPIGFGLMATELRSWLPTV